MPEEFLLSTQLPKCECGANDYVGGFSSGHGTYHRCEACKQVYKAKVVMIEMTKAMEPMLVEL